MDFLSINALQRHNLTKTGSDPGFFKGRLRGDWYLGIADVHKLYQFEDRNLIENRFSTK